MWLCLATCCFLLPLRTLRTAVTRKISRPSRLCSLTDAFSAISGEIIDFRQSNTIISAGVLEIMVAAMICCLSHECMVHGLKTHAFWAVVGAYSKEWSWSAPPEEHARQARLYWVLGIQLVGKQNKFSWAARQVLDNPTKAPSSPQSHHLCGSEHCQWWRCQINWRRLQQCYSS